MRQNLVVAFCIVTLSTQTSAFAQIDKVEYTYRVRGKSTKSNEDRPWSVPYGTRELAERELRRIQRDHASGGLLEASPDKPVGLYIQAYKNGRAVENTQEQPKLKPNRKVGDVLAEYKRNIEDTWRRITEAEDRLTNSAKEVTDDQISAANRLIESYNGKVGEYAEFLDKNPGLNVKPEYTKRPKLSKDDFVARGRKEKPIQKAVGSDTPKTDQDSLDEVVGVWQRMENGKEVFYHMLLERNGKGAHGHYNSVTGQFEVGRTAAYRFTWTRTDTGITIRYHDGSGVPRRLDGDYLRMPVLGEFDTRIDYKRIKK